MKQDDFRVIVKRPGANRSEVEFEVRGAGTSFSLCFRASEPLLEACNEALVACALLPAVVGKLTVNEQVRSFCEENLDALRKLGVRPDIQRALRRRLGRPPWYKRVEPRARHAVHGSAPSRQRG